MSEPGAGSVHPAGVAAVGSDTAGLVKRPVPPESIRGNGAVESDNHHRSVDRVVDDLNAAARMLRTMLRFQVNEEDHQVVVHVIDKDKGTVVRTIPPDQLVDVHASMQSLVGLLLDVRV